MKYLKIILIFLALVAVVVFIVSIPRLIRINEIECQSQEGDCSQYLANNFTTPKGSSLYLVQKEIKQILKNEVLVSSSSFQFIFPDKLKIYVVITKPNIALYNKEKNVFALIDPDGNVVSLVAATNLPYLGGDETIYSIGQKINTQSHFGLNILSYLNYLYQTKRANIENSSLHIELEDGTRVIFPLGGNEKELIGSLRLILSQRENALAGRSVNEIDLRFKNPVIK